jgi:hypothetical protein
MLDVPLTWKSGLALLALNLLDRDGVEAVATAGLEQGFDSPLLRQLAGGSTSHGTDPRVTLTDTLTALGVALTSRPEAARSLAIELSQDILDGRWIQSGPHVNWRRPLEPLAQDSMSWTHLSTQRAKSVQTR